MASKRKQGTASSDRKKKPATSGLDIEAISKLESSIISSPSNVNSIIDLLSVATDSKVSKVSEAAFQGLFVGLSQSSSLQDLLPL